MRSFQLTSLAFFLILLGFIAITKSSYAAFLIVDEQGNLVWQVLSSEDDRNSDDGDKSGSSGRGNSSGSGSSGTSESSLTSSPSVSSPKVEEKDRGEEKKIEKPKREMKFEVEITNRGKGKATGQEIRIKTEEGKVKLRVGTESGATEMDVSELKEDIVRIKERVENQELRIRAKKGRLEIRQRGVGALTNFPLSISEETNELTVTTPSGVRVIKVLPQTAVQNILQSNIMDKVSSASALPEAEKTTEDAEFEEEVEQEVELVEEKKEVAFKIKGEKNVRLLNFIPLEVPVTALVSAQTGETLQIERPWFLNFFGFLFSQ